MKVTLRQKKISKGRISLYLDFYPPLVDPETKKSTRREFLKLYLFDKPRTTLEKNHNRETKLQAQSICSARQLDIQANRFDFIFKDSKQIDFLQFFKKLTNSYSPRLSRRDAYGKTRICESGVYNASEHIQKSNQILKSITAIQSPISSTLVTNHSRQVKQFFRDWCQNRNDVLRRHLPSPSSKRDYRCFFFDTKTHFLLT